MIPGLQSCQIGICNSKSKLPHDLIGGITITQVVTRFVDWVDVPSLAMGLRLEEDVALEAFGEGGGLGRGSEGRGYKSDKKQK